MKILILPTYLLLNFFRPALPYTHPFKRVCPTLKQWAEGATKLNIAFSITFWVCGLAILASLMVSLLP